MSKNLSSKKNVLILIIAIIVSLPVFITGCGKKDSTASLPGASSKKVVDEIKADSDGLIPITTWTKTDCGSTVWVVADAKGFFKKYGLKSVYTGVTQSTVQIPSILKGDNVVGDFHPNTYAVAIAGKANLIGIGAKGIDPAANINPSLRHMWWFVSKKSGIKTFKQLIDYKKGKKLKFTTGAQNICTDFLGNSIADKYGLPRDRIEWVTMPDVQAIQSLTQGLVDVAAVHPPYYKGMVNAGNTKIADSLDANLGPTAGLTEWVVNTDWAKKNPNTTKKFLQAALEAQIWSNHNPKEAADLTAKHIGQPVSGNHYYNEALAIPNDKYLQPWIDGLVTNGTLEKGQIKVSDLVTDIYYKSK